MKSDARLDAIESGLLHLGTEDAAKDLLLMAFIATHPRPQALKAALQLILEGNELRASDVGFANDWKPEQVQTMNTNVRAVVARWLQHIPAA